MNKKNQVGIFMSLADPNPDGEGDPQGNPDEEIND